MLQGDCNTFVCKAGKPSFLAINTRLVCANVTLGGASASIVQIVLPGQAEDTARLNEIVAAYKRRFKQQSVGIIVRPACVSF